MSTASNVLDIARSWLGLNEADGSFKQILDVYNSYKPLARGYAIKTTDEWCDATVSAIAIKAGAVDLIGTEVGCERHIAIFKEKGIWIEDGTITPEPGYIILFNWDGKAQPNDGSADHIGYVEQVYADRIICIEGNKGGKVDRRSIPLRWNLIRGFAAPKYDQPKESEDEEMTQEEFNKKMAVFLDSLSTQEPSEWSKDSREWAESRGIITGDAKSNMRYKSYVTREQMAVFAKRIYELK